MKYSTKLALWLVAWLSITAYGDTRKHVKGTVPIPPTKKSVGSPPTPAPPTKGGAATPASSTPEQTGRAPAPKQRLADFPTDDDNPPSPGECADKHSIETFVQISSANGPQAAKTGGVYFLSDLREVPQVFFLSSAQGWPEQASFFPDGVAYFRVSPDGLKILLATQQGGNEQYGIHLLEPKTKKLTPLVVEPNTRVESVEWESGSRFFYFTSNQRNQTDMDLYRYDVAERKSTLVVEMTGHNVVSDISPNGQMVALTRYRSATDSEVLLWNSETGEILNLAKGITDRVFRDATFTLNAKSVFVLSDLDKGVTQLYLVSIGDRKMKLLTSGPWEVEEYTLNNERTALSYLVNEDGYSRQEAYQLGGTGLKGKPIPLPQKMPQVLHSVSFAYGQGKNAFFYAKSSATRSSDIWLWKPSQNIPWTLSTHGLIRPHCFSREKLVRYPSFDKVEIPAFLYLPAEATGPVPFIVYVHGGPESQYRPGFNRIFQYFLERGFGVFAPNVRGSSGYGRDYTLLDNYKKRIDSVKDAIEGARWLIQKQHTKAGQLAIYGGSYGGFMVLRSIELEPDLFSAASESVGITDFVTFLKNTKPYRRALREAEYGPLSDPEFLKSISPMTYVESIKTPLLIFHGANDPRVPVDETQQIVKELTRRNIPVEFKIFADEGHGNTKLRNIMEQAKQMVYFFEKQVTTGEKVKKGP